MRATTADTPAAAAPARLQLRASGYPQLWVDGRPAALKLKRGLALLVYLSELGRKLARSHLAELLWPDAAPELGRTRLRRLCHEVNAVLGIELLAGDNDALWLAGADAALASDVAGVRALALQLLTAPDGAPDAAADAAVWQRLCAPEATDLLEGFDLASDRYMAWCDGRRAEHRQLLVRALTRLAALAQRRGAPAQAAEAAQALIRLDPLADAGHAALLAARAQLGDAAGVEAAYFGCAELLRTELGIRPSAQIERIYAQAQRQLALQPGERQAPALPTAPIAFADSEGGTLAHLRLGSPHAPCGTLIVLFGLWSHVEVAWEHAGIRALLERLAQRFQVVLLDRRGIGLSERLTLPQALNAGVQDVDAVRRALGVERVWLFGSTVGGAIAIEYAGAQPQHVQGLMLYAAQARGAWADDYPWALRPEQMAAWLQRLQSAWGLATSLEHFAPSLAADEAARHWWARMLRQAASRNSLPAILRGFASVDVRARLPALRVPTLIVQREADRIVRAGVARYLAARIPGAQLCLLPGEDHLLWAGDSGAVLDALEDFVQRRAPG
ncbi:MAG TPA: alpha/beta fold hydrolase [Rubrivivax sp.]|nr:alpha/beta fold hydrolase [Rubrivivax sp.]